jgi:hypothetical protein
MVNFQFPGKSPFGILLMLFAGFFLVQCEKEPFLEPVDEPDEEESFEYTADSAAIERLPAYYNLLVTLKEQGYKFYSFERYMKTDTADLPEKLIVLRHDVHIRDLTWAYFAFEIEKVVIGPAHSTFYVMWNDPLEVANASAIWQIKYLKLIHYLDSCHVDVQPHVSPIDLYISKLHPGWENCNADSLKKLFDSNYEWVVCKTGRRIATTGTDVFNMHDINVNIVHIMEEYNAQWTAVTGLPVQGYAAHGSASDMNKFLNNAWLLDQVLLLHSGVYQYDTYNTKISRVLGYLSDNTLPDWMKNPASIPPGRYQLLMHPYQWIKR